METFTGSAEDVINSMATMRINSELFNVTIVGKSPQGIKTPHSAHRDIMAATIPYFKYLFINDPNLKVVEVDVDDHSALEKLINFAYTRKLTLDDGTVQPTLHLAEFLQMDDAREICIKFINKRLNVCNLFQIRFMARERAYYPLIESTEAYLSNNFAKLSLESRGFKELDVNDLLEILSSSKLNISSEEEVFKAVAGWVDYKFRERKDSMADLLKKVRLPLIKPKYLADVVQAHPACRVNNTCVKMIKQAQSYHVNSQTRHSYDALTTTARCPNGQENIFVIGGHSGHQSGNQALDTVSDLGAGSQQWRTRARMNKSRTAMGVTVLKGQIYVTGGFQGDSGTNTVETYSRTLDKWTFVAPLNEPRWSHGSCTVNDRMYVCGGYYQKRLNTCEEFHNGTWRVIANMKESRANPAVVAYQHRVWVLGGVNINNKSLRTIEIYDQQLQRWSSRAPQMLTERTSCSAAVVADRLYVMGGFIRRDEWPLDTCEMYNPGTRQFTFVRNMPVGSCRLAVAVRDTFIYCLGGIDDPVTSRDGNSGRKTNKVHIYDTVGNVWFQGDDLPNQYGCVGAVACP